MKALFILLLAISTLFTEVCCSHPTTSGKPKKQLASQQTGFTTIYDHDLHYSIDVATTMSAVHNLNADASLQYSDNSMGEYLIVVEEPVTMVTEELKAMKKYNDQLSFIDNFSAFRLGEISENSLSTEQVTTITSNNGQLKTIHLKASVTGIPEKIAYTIGFTYHGNHSFMIMAWTLESNDHLFHPKAEKMISSFNYHTAK